MDRVYQPTLHLLPAGLAGDAGGYLSRVDPRARVVAAAIFSLVVAAVHGWAALVIALAAAVLGIAWSGLSPAVVLRRLLPLEVLLFLLILILPTSSGARARKSARWCFPTPGSCWACALL